MNVESLLDERYDPDRQMPLPFPAAVDYAKTVMAWAQAPLPSEVVIHANIRYGAHPLQRYDVFAPKDASNAPVLMFWHGGGWTNGYPAYARFMAPLVTRLGCILVTPAYRLAPAHDLSQAYDDAMAACAHVQANATGWGGNRSRIILSGHSAGGHLACLVAMRRRDREALGVMDSDIAACAPISAILDIHHPEPTDGSMEQRIYTLVLKDADQDATLSPLLWGAGNEVPTTLVYGELDSERVVRSNVRMHTILKLQPGPSAAICIRGASHFDTHTGLSDPAHPWWRVVANAIAN